jgi:hypothetical protein
VIVLVAVVAAVVLVAAAVVGLTRRDRSPLARAEAITGQDSRWATATASGESMAEMATLLISAGRQCQRDGGGQRCESILAAAGWSETAAFRVLRCTRPGVYATRSSARTLVTHLRRHQPAPLPPTPRC